MNRCQKPYRSLMRLPIGFACPDCEHSPLVHTDETGCSLCAALDASLLARLAALEARLTALEAQP